MRRLTRGVAALAVGLACLLAGASSGTASASAAAIVTTAPGPVGGPLMASPGVVTDLPPGVPAPPPFTAAGWVLADLDTGQVIAAHNAHGRFLPASTLKTLTALTTLTMTPAVDPNTVVRPLNEDLVEGTQVGLDPRSTYTVRQLMQGMMLSSGNDTATALARVAGGAGGVPATVAAMQANARRLGALDTVVHNPSGLDAPGQVSSAYDLALVARAALAVPQFRELVGSKHVLFPSKELPGKRRSAYQISNHNSFLFNYDGAIGVKNGYTVAARWTAIAAATRGGHTYVLTAMRRGESSWRPQAAMFDWAFAHGAQARPVGTLVTPEEVAAQQSGGQPTAAAAPVGASGRTALPPAAAGGRHAARLVGLGAAVAAMLVASLVGLSARARRRQLHAARLARSVRQTVR